MSLSLYYMLLGNFKDDDLKHGCGRECYKNLTSTSEKKKTGDYLLIPGGKYNDKTGVGKKTYYNDIYCGDGLGDYDMSFNGQEMVSVDRPGPVTLR